MLASNTMEEKQFNPLSGKGNAGILAPLVKTIWAGWKTVALCTLVFMILGLVAALTMRRTYAVSTVMVPQVGSGQSSLNGLASLAGFDLGTSPASDLSPITYPQIVSSVPFRLELMHTPLHYAKADTTVSLLDYARDYAKPSVTDVLKEYTIGLPGLIINALRGEKAPLVLPEGEEKEGPRPLLLSRDEQKMLPRIERMVSLSVDARNGFITMWVSGIEPIQTAELAMAAQRLLQDAITRFRTEKAQAELEYVQARYDEVKAEANNYQGQLATIRDRSQNLATTRSRIEMERIQFKYNVVNSIYMEMAQQLEQAKMQVKKDTPSFTIIQPVTVPDKPSNSRSKTLIIWTVVGFLIGCVIVLSKASILPRIKKAFS